MERAVLHNFGGSAFQSHPPFATHLRAKAGGSGGGLDRLPESAGSPGGLVP